MNKRIWSWAGACLLIASAAYADVLPPDASDTEWRFAAGLFDRTDQYCKNKNSGAACSVPGTAFAGGGKGVCERQYLRGDLQIDLRCTPINKLEIDRRVPDGPFHRDPGHCKNTSDPDPNHACTDWPPIADRFCDGRKQGDVCNAEFKVAGKVQSEVGRCNMTIEERKPYHFGYPHASRRVLLCQATSPAPIRLSPVPISARLRQ